MKAKEHAVYTFTLLYVVLHTGVATRFLTHDSVSQLLPLGSLLSPVQQIEIQEMENTAETKLQKVIFKNIPLVKILLFFFFFLKKRNK